MNSSKTCARKSRSKVTNVPCQKITSSNRSRISHSRPAACKDRMKVILKARQEMVSVLQDACQDLCCVVTSNPKAYQKFVNNMKLARNKILAINSKLNSVTKDLEQELLLLKTDDSKRPLFRGASQSRNGFENIISNVAESVEALKISEPETENIISNMAESVEALKISEPETSIKPEVTTKNTQASLNLAKNIQGSANLNHKDPAHEIRNKSKEMLVEEVVTETVPRLLDAKNDQDSMFAGHTSASPTPGFLLPKVSKDESNFMYF